MKDDQIINKKFHYLQRKKILLDKEKFIYKEIATRLNQSLEGIKINLKNCLEVGYNSNNILNYINSRFKNVNYSVLEISKDLLNNLDQNIKSFNHDHDQWELINEKYDMIISNFYIHITNNLSLLINNIYKSLNKNGFFIASLPGINCFLELKKAMIQTDLEIYDGAYKRFIDLCSVDILTKILKTNKFNNPIIEIDNIQLRYREFNKLLNDVRNLGNSYVCYDRKSKFEKKNYFMKLEEIYWENYSNKDELILQLEIIYISAWK